MKKKNIFIAIIIILLVFAGVLTLLNKKSINIEPIDVSNTTISQEEGTSEVVSEEDKKKNQEQFADPLVVLRRTLKNKARFFIERYNTYSTDNNQENLRSLLSQVSNKLAKEIEGDLTRIDPSDIFFSFQTKVLSLDLLDFINNEEAIFEGQIQEQETRGETTEVHYKTATLEFIYENSEWKVDDIEIN